MRESADGDQVDAGPSDGAHRTEFDTACRFDRDLLTRFMADDLDGPAHDPINERLRA